MHWIDSELFEFFPTHILGKITSDQAVNTLSQDLHWQLPADAATSRFIDPGKGNFLVPYEDGWISIWTYDERKEG